MNGKRSSLLITGATIISGATDRPIEGQSILIEGNRIKAIARRDELTAPAGANVIDARGKFAIPGLMNANVHLLCDIRLENLARYWGRYDELITEAAQVALKGGVTTVFDTWGPRRFLMTVRDRIDAGSSPGSRIFCAGNIIGFDGPFSQDYFAKALEVASSTLANRINAIWVENTGRHLMWLTPDEVAKQIRIYIAKGINFLKYGSNDHNPGSYLVFSPAVQAAIVGEAHRAGITAQAHTTTVEGLRIAIEAECDLIQHANITGSVSIPETTLELMAKRGTGAVVFPWTERGLKWIMENTSKWEQTLWAASDINTRNLVRAGVPLLMANDGVVYAPEAFTDPTFDFSKSWSGVPGDDGLIPLGTGHFAWFKAMEEKGLPPMEMLRAATRNIATAYGKGKELGTLEPGKLADVLILNKNPLVAADNYRSIDLIIKNGGIVDREALPLKPLLTQPMEAPVEEEAAYISAFGSTKIPMCPMCVGRHSRL